MTYRLQDALRQELGKCFPEDYKLRLPTLLDTKRLDAGEIVPGETLLVAEDRIVGLEKIIDRYAEKAQIAKANASKQEKHKQAFLEWLERVNKLAVQLEDELKNELEVGTPEVEEEANANNLEQHKQAFLEWTERGDEEKGSSNAWMWLMHTTVEDFQRKNRKNQEQMQKLESCAQELRAKFEAIKTLPKILSSLTDLTATCTAYYKRGGAPKKPPERVWMAMDIHKWMKGCCGSGADTKPTSTRNGLFERLLREAMKATGEQVSLTAYSHDGKLEHTIEFCGTAYNLALTTLQAYPKD